MKPVRIAIAALAAAAFAPAAFACTLCDSDVAGQVRATVFGPHLLGDLAGLAAPIPVLLVAILAVRRLIQ